MGDRTRAVVGRWAGCWAVLGRWAVCWAVLASLIGGAWALGGTGGGLWDGTWVGTGGGRARAERAASAQEPGAAGAVQPGAPWVWPTGSRVVSRPWEAPEDEYAAGHRGIDVRAALGTPAVAVADGTVTFAGAVAGRSVVSIDHGHGLVSTLDSVAPTVSTGDEVTQGQTVGIVAVGHCPANDPCVHLGARLDERYVDPAPYLPAAAWPVLLPESAWPG
ncbi:peptidase M23 [Curtobacterium sp. 'Ferrero']|uniref:M23 family metallopeptidase n=1 Tax=Curtobacterium sp. 'Ferrero' TaxID=2033654 RepID=UPI000BD726DC|nr:M23 family metallopeptidase [Curtobacterium sp. 'Ferrero']PCN47404.1 peptidase M23 [Curtobacterium sp. 'Ferrero']